MQAKCWHPAITRSVELTEVHRQSDKQFIALLQNIRIGRCPPAVADILAATSGQTIERDGIRATRLYTHKGDVEATNSRELEALAGEVRQFQAQDSDPQMEKTLDSMCPVGKTVDLKIGAQVRRGIEGGGAALLIPPPQEEKGLLAPLPNSPQGIAGGWPS